MNRKYEVMVILDPKLNDTQIEQNLAKYTELIKSSQGQIDNTIEWGLKKLAYPIQGHGEGNYQILQFSSPITARDELDRLLKLDDQILRHKIIKL